MTLPGHLYQDSCTFIMDNNAATDGWCSSDHNQDSLHVQGHHQQCILRQCVAWRQMVCLHTGITLLLLIENTRCSAQMTINLANAAMFSKGLAVNLQVGSYPQVSICFYSLLGCCKSWA